MSTPEAAVITTLLAQVSRRLRLRRALRAGAATLGLALVVAIAAWWQGGGAPWWPVATAVVVVAAVGMAWWFGDGDVVAAAGEVERVDPTFRNLLRTAAEVVTAHGEGETPPSYGEALVLARAGAALEGKRAAHYVPLAAPTAVVGAALGAALLTGWGLRATDGATLPQLLGGVSGATISAVEITVTSPPYASRPAVTSRDPARLELLAGSRIALTVRGAADEVTVETADGVARLAASSPGRFTGDVTAREDGFLAITAVATGSDDTVRRLVAVGVTPDRAPRVRVTAPARDLLLQDGRGTIALSVEADDDIGLASLALRYTVVTGSGEQFTFREGALPLAVTRSSATNWRASATWRLDSLGLEPGDMVVYRAVAADRRPGSEAVESDAWIVEVRSPGALAVDGFAIDPEEERYAISQQMVILKTERLLARQATLSAAAFADSAAELAAEQRKVRSEFVFMMGGEVEDGHHGEVSQTELNEVAEAEAEDELAAGRMLNAGRMAIVRGIRHMSQAASLLDVTSVTAALVEERRALKEINEAFSRSRIILRALTVPERLDPTRRLSGSLVEALGASRPVERALPEERQEALAALLARLGDLAGGAQPPATRAATADRLAGAALRIDPSARTLQRASTALLDAAAAWRRQDDPAARAALARAATDVTAEAAPGALPASRRTASPAFDRLRGALGDGARRP